MSTGHEAVSLAERAKQEGQRILKYWRTNVLLPGGGFHGEIGNDGRVREDAPRSLILATRILWTFSRAINSRFADTTEHRAIVDAAFHDLIRHFWDPVHRGFFWMINTDGQPVQDFKHIYGQAFAIYALAEYYGASGQEEARQFARQTYELVEQKAADDVNGGYLESFHRNWELDAVRQDTPVNRGGPKSMNSHLHLLEAYTCLYQVWPSQDLAMRLGALLDVVTARIVEPKTSHFHLFFDERWQPTDEIESYGHDIEGAWLIWEAAEVLGDETRLSACRRLAVKMVDAVLDKGVASNYGVMFEGKGNDVLDSDVHWWPQAEGVVGCVNAYQLTGDLRYLQTAIGMWTFIERYLFDPDGGDWLMKVSRGGERTGTFPRVSAWKGPYHNARACMEIVRRLDTRDAME